ncbi:MAG: hypothetical protein A3G25_21750 [Betaproteobacteria bacterium RIFCSPLOWO2_12_FULL_63_13]|nr:MAG: hypothetical protein A3G25_21750 [Betaproteobacteria bacterium RIFCSPLOWO2_12_FULL_63_13]
MDSLRAGAVTALTEDTIVKIVKRLALLFALSATIALPGGYFSLEYSNGVQHLETVAQVKVEAINRLARVNPDLWMYQVLRIEELLQSDRVLRRNERVTVSDAAGEVILAVGAPSEAPIIMRTFPIYDSGRTVGHVEVAHSYRNVIYGTVAAGLLGVLLGGLVYATLLVLPMRALRRVTAALNKETEARNAAAALSRAVTETANDAIVIADGSGAIVGWNPAAERMFGYSQAELIGQPLTLVLPQRYHQRHLEGIRRVQTGSSWNVFGKSVELHGLTKARREFPIELSLSAWETPDENYFAGIIRDISERKQAEEALAERDSRYRAVVEMSSDGFWAVDQDGRLLDVNEAYVRRSGFTRDELVGMHIVDLDAKESAADIASHIEAIRDKGADVFDTLHRTKGGVTWPVEVTVRHRLDRKGQFLCFLRDITERRRVEEERRRSAELLQARTAELERSHQLLQALTAVQESVQEEERKRIARELHDELSQKLTVLKLQTALALSTFAQGDSDLNRQLKDIDSLLTETMHSVSQIATNLRPVVLDELGLVVALRDLVERFSERTKIECEFSVHPPDLSIDDKLAMPLYRMVQESLTNVARHAEASETTVSLHRDGSGMLTLSISDNGKGVSDEDRPGRGSFGLMGMRERAAMLGGELRVHSRSGAGTLIEIVIP